MSQERFSGGFNIYGGRSDVEKVQRKISIDYIEANNVINVYYVKDDFTYTTHYFYEGVEDTTKVETKSATFSEEITTYEDKNITGYKLDKVTLKDGSIIEVENNSTVLDVAKKISEGIKIELNM